MRRVVTVGGGIVGTSCAYHLWDDDYDMTVVEREEIGGATTTALMTVFS